MTDFERQLNQQLEDLRQQGLYRELRRVDSPQTPRRLALEGRLFLNFSSNDYLGLANEPALREAAIKAIERYGVGAGASRLICGSLAVFHELEETLAAFKSAPAALSFSSGYAAAVGVLTAVLSSDDIVILDKLVHASIVDAARLSSAKLRVFRHNDLEALEKILQWADRQGAKKPGVLPRKLIVTESIFSMDGDSAPLRELAELKEKYGAWLMVDEAHATGLYGKNRRGLAEQMEAGDRIEIQMGTLGKAAGAAGGFICGARPLIDLLVNRARSFIFSTAPAPAAAAAATAGINFIRSTAGEERRQALWQRVADFVARLPGLAPDPCGAIIPVVLGDENQALAAARQLREQGIFVPAIRYPTVARQEARLRVTLTAGHTAAEVATLAGALAGIAVRRF